jgi:CBS domain-containing protein
MMSQLDQKELISSIHPFDLLSSDELERVMDTMDIAYYPKETVLISSSLAPSSLYIIIKGTVNELVEDELQNVYGDGDSFDANALIYAKTQSRFVVQEDLICYELPKEVFLNLLQDIEAFKNYYMQDFAQKHQSLKQRHIQNELTPFMVARVEEIFLHVPCIVDAKTAIFDALKQMSEQKAKVILVDNGGEIGIVTDTDLRERVLLGDISVENPIIDIATSPVISILKQDFLFNALLYFTKYSIKRLVVMDEDKIVGILEQLDLLSYFASHSHLIAMQIIKAQDTSQLKLIGRDLLNLVRSLSSKGVKVRYISKLVSELNAKMMEKVFELSVPPELRQKCALIIMGSEGREEQLLRTDQDNALIIADNTEEDFKPYMLDFNTKLQEIGFPQCLGDVMVSNDYWRRDVGSFKRLIDEWVDTLNQDSLQSLSIFLDAKVIAGDKTLLLHVKEYLYSRFDGHDDNLAHIAKAALEFDTPVSHLFGFVYGSDEHKSEFDIKKGGIFAIVHGIRTLALEHKLEQTNTIERIKQLNNSGIFDKKFATELMEAFDTLLNIRLHYQLKQPDPMSSNNYINPKRLEKIERDLLKESFKVVNTFKKFLTYHFHLNMVM